VPESFQPSIANGWCISTTPGPERPWFAGGTVDWVSIRHRRHQLRRTLEAFEDGTPNYYGIAALEAGFAFLNRVGIDRVAARVADLTSRLLTGLQEIRHRHGAPLVQLYGPPDGRNRGGTAAFNLLDRHGRVVPYEKVETRARSAGIALRGGCFCNPGCAEAAFQFPAGATLRCLRRTAEFTPRRLARCLGGGTPVGAIRDSVGVATSEQDIDRALEVLTRIGRY
jgi:selenocysteine lyase/cysteine desulfurase